MYEEGTNPCPKCRERGEDTSGDNFHYYGDGLGGHCFTKEVKVITKEGVLPIGSLIGERVSIVNGQSKWEEVEFKSYGSKQIWNLELTRNGIKKTIRTTSHHRWYKKRGRNSVYTRDLKLGDYLESRQLPVTSSYEISVEGVVHGFIYGDGSKRLDRPSCTVPFYTEQKEALIDLFYQSENLNSIYTKKIKGVLKNVASVRDVDGRYKKLPDVSKESLDYLYGFIAGYFAADGNISKGTASIHSTKYEDLIFIEKVCLLLGVRTHPIFYQVREAGQTYLKDRDSTIYGLRFFVTDLGEDFFLRGGHIKPERVYEYSRWKVVSVKETTVFEEVYCCETSTGSFVLEDYLLTGNCFSCGYTLPSDEYIDERNLKVRGDKNVIRESDLEKMREKSFTEEQLKEFQDKTVGALDPKYKYRGLDTSVCKALGVRWSVDAAGKPTAMHYPATVKDENGEEVITGYKSRELPKKFYSSGYVGKCSGFFGQNKAIAETLIIVAGEVDLITAISAMENSDKYRKNYNIVSSPLGEESTAQVIKINYDWVNAHKKIIVCMDDDEAGQNAFLKIQDVVDNDKLFKANLRHNDLNDYLKNKDGDKIAGDIYWNPTPVKTYGIVGSDKIFDRILDAVSTERIPLPPFLHGLDNVFAGGIPLGEVVNIISSVSTGKTVFINEIIMHWLIYSPHRVFIASLEDNVGSYGAKMASRVSGKNILAMRSIEERRAAVMACKKEVSEFLYDEFGNSRFDMLEKVPSNLEELKEAILYAIKVLGCKIFLFDPLQSIIGTKSLEQQVDWMNFEETIRREHDVTVVNIAHTRKSGSNQKAHSEGGEIVEEDVKGSSQISATATINIILSRNKMAEDEIEKNTTYIDIPKNRTIGITGKDVAKIYYSQAHHTLFDFEYAKEHNFFKGITPEQLKGLLDPNKATIASPDVFDEDDGIEMMSDF